MALIHELTNTVMLAVPDAPEPAVTRAYLEAARQFFTQTRAWRDNDQRLARIESAGRAGVGAFQATIDDETEAFDAIVVRFEGYKLKKVARTDMTGLREGSYGRPAHYCVTKNLIEVTPDPGPGPSSESRLTALLALRPARSAVELDDDIADRWGEIIEQGAIGRLLMQPRQDWTDYNGAMLYKASFEDHINTWRSRAGDDGQVGVVRTVRYGGY